MRRIVLNLLSLLLIGCSFPKGDHYIFPKEERLLAQTVEIDTGLFRYAFRIRAQADTAIVMDLHGADYFYHAFTYPDFRYLTSFGKHGGSPQEMLSAENVRYANGIVWTLDANKSEMVRLEWALLKDSLVRKEAISFGDGILRALDFAIYDDSTFIVPDYSGESRFCRVDRKGQLLCKEGFIPTRHTQMLKNAGPAMAQAWRSFIDYNPRNGVLAAVTQLGEVLEIYNLQDSTHVVRFGPYGEPEFRVSEGYAVPSGIMGFSDVQVTDHAIYAVFHGRTFKELSQQRGELIDGGQYIYVFSLTGEPLCKYVLDRFIYGICVDEKNKTIIATDVNSDQPIVMFNTKIG